MTDTPHTDLQHKIEHKLMGAAHTGSMMEGGKTISPSMFSEDAKDIMSLFEQEINKARVKLLEDLAKDDSAVFHAIEEPTDEMVRIHEGQQGLYKAKIEALKPKNGGNNE